MSITVDTTKDELTDLEDEIGAVNNVILFLKDACIAVARTRGDSGDISDSSAHGLNEIFLWVNERLQNVSDQVMGKKDPEKRPKMN